MTDEEEGWLREFYTFTSDTRQHECHLEIQRELDRVPDPEEEKEKIILLQRRCVDLLINLGELQERREDQERMVEEKEGPTNFLTPSIMAMIQGSLVGFFTDSLGLAMCASVVGALMGSLYVYRPKRKCYLDEKGKVLINLLKKLTR